MIKIKNKGIDSDYVYTTEEIDEKNAEQSSQIANKTETVYLYYDEDDNRINNEQGVIRTFSQIKALVDDKTKQVIVNRSDNMYYLSWVATDSVEFSNVFVAEGYAYDERIIINSKNVVKYTMIKNPKDEEIENLKSVYDLYDMNVSFLKVTPTDLHPSGYRNGTYTSANIGTTTRNWVRTDTNINIPKFVKNITVIPKPNHTTRVVWFSEKPSISNNADLSNIVLSFNEITTETEFNVIDNGLLYISYYDRYNDEPFDTSNQPTIYFNFKIVDYIKENRKIIENNLSNIISRNENGVLFDKYIGKTPSALAVIKDKLYIFQYHSGDEHTESDVYIYNINNDGSLTNTNTILKSNIGHQNTVDYNPSNDTLITSNAGSSSNTEANTIYIFENASTLTEFKIENAISIDLSQSSLGLQPNVVWGNSDTKENLIYIVANYYSGKVNDWTTNNVNNFPSNQQNKRFLYLIKLGIGTEDLSLNDNGFGNYVNRNTYNGTFEIIKRYDFNFEFDDAVNDMCFINGNLYYVPIKSMTGVPIIKLSFDNYGNDIVVNKKYLESILHPAREKEGIAYNDKYMFLGSVSSRIYTVKRDSILNL